jgi:hypothetical protein
MAMNSDFINQPFIVLTETKFSGDDLELLARVARGSLIA